MSLATERWSEIAALFDELVELDPAQRAERLDALGERDATLAAEVRALLDADESANTMLDNDAVAALPAMLADLDAALGDGTIGSHRSGLRSTSSGTDDPRKTTLFDSLGVRNNPTRERGNQWHVHDW